MNRVTQALLALTGSFLIFAVACGGDDSPATKPAVTTVPTNTSSPTAVATAEPPTAIPATEPALPTLTPEGPLRLEISVNGNQLEFNKDKFEVSAGAQVTLVFDNVSDFNQHNWVLVQAGTKDDVATDGLGVGPDQDYVKPGDARVVVHTKLLDAGTTGEVSFAAPAPGTYQFTCTFPGHNFTMSGDLVVNP